MTALWNQPVAPVRAILLGGGFVALFDIIDPIIFYGIRNGTAPIRIFQSIAGGLLGRATYDGGLATAVLGGCLHLFIATSIVATCVAAGRVLPWLTAQPLMTAPLWGIGVFVFMNTVVLPLSKVGWPRFSWPWLINGLLIHMFGVGLPSVLAARAARRYQPATAA